MDGEMAWNHLILKLGCYNIAFWGTYILLQILQGWLEKSEVWNFFNYVEKLPWSLNWRRRIATWESWWPYDNYGSIGMFRTLKSSKTSFHQEVMEHYVFNSSIIHIGLNVWNIQHLISFLVNSDSPYMI